MLAAVLIFLGAFVCFYPLTLCVSVKNGQTQLAWLPRLCGGYAAPRPLPLSRGRSGEGRAGKEKEAARRHFKLAAYRPLLLRLLSQASVDKLECRVGIGAADPFATSMLAGIVMAALGGVGGVVSASVKSFPPLPWLSVVPLEQGGFSASLECIFHIRCGDIIGSIICFLWLKRKGG